MTDDIVVVANNAEEMRNAQSSLIVFFDDKIKNLGVSLHEAEENVSIARKRKWKTLPFINTQNKISKDISFYEKINAALKAGYVIIPNFDNLDIFAIRTTRKNPKKNIAKGGANWVQIPNQQQSNRPSLGEGKYVNADSVNEEWTDKEKLSDGSLVDKTYSMAIDFDVVDFPFKFVKPQILERTSQAMDKLIFDDIGISPSRNVKRGDPMVIGRILGEKVGYSQKFVSFLITWFVDTSMI